MIENALKFIWTTSRIDMFAVSSDMKCISYTCHMILRCSFITDCKSHCVLLLEEEQRKCHLRLSIKCFIAALPSSGGGH